MAEIISDLKPLFNKFIDMRKPAKDLINFTL